MTGATRHAGVAALLVLAFTGGTGIVEATEPSPARAPAKAPAADPAIAFGSREAILDISLSPDGHKIAILAPNGPRGTVVMVGSTDAPGFKPLYTSRGGDEWLQQCRWSANTRLVCRVAAIGRVSGPLIGFTRTISLDTDGNGAKLLSARDNANALGLMQNGGSTIDWLADEGREASGGALLMTRQFVPEKTTGTHTANTRRGLGVERVDTTTLKRTVVEPPVASAVEYITDGHGTVRIRGLRQSDSFGNDASVINYAFRTPGSRDWQALGRYELDTNRGFNPYAVDRDLNVAYGFDKHQGRSALFKVALDGTGKRELVYAHPGVDVDSLIRVGRQQRVVGVSFATERRESAFFDPELKRLSQSLSRALPQHPLVQFVDASADEKRLLMWVGSDVDPGRYYLYDKPSRRLEELLPVRPQLGKVTLSSVKAVTFPAADGTGIPAYLTLPPGSDGRNLPTIVMPHGGPAARDEWGFDWLSQYFAQRGFAVLQPNFRGSSGYGEAWFQRNGFQSWRTAVGDVTDGGRWLVAQGIADPGKMAIFGWSYGGYAALQSAVLDPGLFKAVVAVAPVTDLEQLRQDAREYTSYAAVDRYIGRGAHVREGSPAQNARSIKVPVLLFHGDLDQNVAIGQSQLMASRLKSAGGRVELVTFPGLNHQLPDSDARAQMLSRSDVFLRDAMGMARQGM